MTGVDVAELRRLLAAATPARSRADIDAIEHALLAHADALLDAAEAVDRVTALADKWENDGVRHVRGYVDTRLAALRAALVAPNNHGGRWIRAGYDENGDFDVTIDPATPAALNPKDRPALPPRPGDATYPVDES